jgi:hypothetical protein
MTRGLAAAIAIAASVGAGLVHLALGPEHLEELGALGWGFYLAAALQIGWAAAMLLIRGEVRVRQLAIAGVGINVAIIGAWLVSRTVGLPAGETPWVPESIGPVDSITAALEVVVAAVLLAALRIRNTAGAGSARMATALAVLVIAAGTAVALTREDSHADGHAGMSHEAMVEGGSAP